jgi:hypothetical protein
MLVKPVSSFLLHELKNSKPAATTASLVRVCVDFILARFFLPSITPPYPKGCGTTYAKNKAGLVFKQGLLFKILNAA